MADREHIDRFAIHPIEELVRKVAEGDHVNASPPLNPWRAVWKLRDSPLIVASLASNGASAAGQRRL
jgi:hypothetical protein